MSEKDITVVSSASTSSISGNSTITYESGVQGENRYIRLAANSSGGLFCKDWIPTEEIRKLISGKTEITSKTLAPLYIGKSANSPGFLLACVLHEQMHSPPATPQKKPAKDKKSDIQEGTS